MQQPDIIDLTDRPMSDPLLPNRFTSGTGPLRWRRKVQDVIARVRIATLDHREAPFNLAPQCAHLLLVVANGDVHEAVHDATRIFWEEHPKTPERGQAGPTSYGQHADNWWDIQSHSNRNFDYSNKKKDKHRKV